MGISNWALAKALEKLSPDSINVGVPECESLDLYKVIITCSDDKTFLVDSISEGTLVGRQFNDETKKHDTQSTLDLNDGNTKGLTIRHYYKCHLYEYNSISTFVLFNLTGLVKLQNASFRLIDSVVQYFFNRRTLHLKERVALLRYLVENYGTNGRDFGTLSMSLDLYSLRSLNHPQRKALIKKMDLYLASFVDSGEIQHNPQGGLPYRVTPKAIQTLDVYEIEERRHNDSLRTQRLVIWLTVLMAISAVVQAGFIKLDPILNFSKQQTTSANTKCEVK